MSPSSISVDSSSSFVRPFALNIPCPSHHLYSSNKSGSRYWIDLLSGNTQLREGIEKGMSVDEIVAQWQQELDWFMAMSQKYLMYGD